MATATPSSAAPNVNTPIPTITTRMATLPPGTNSTSSTSPAPKSQSTSPTHNTTPVILKDTLRSGRPTKKHTLRPHTLHKLHSAFSPSTHDRDEKLPPIQSITARPYLHTRQRWRLWRLSIGEFGLTVLLCLSYFLIIYMYSHLVPVNRQQRHYFNALATGNALLLGVNLAGSLRSYAKMLRWRILASRYRTLTNFDLVMGCHDVLNVFKLFWRSNWFSLTQLFCVIWILVQLGAAVGIGAIGLTYNFEVSNDWVVIQIGNTSVIDFNNLIWPDELTTVARAHGWGLRGVTTIPLEGTTKAELVGNGSLYLWSWEGDGARSRYFFRDQNPIVSPDGLVTSDITDRYLDSIAFCTAYEVTEGEYGDLPYIIYRDPITSDEFNETIYQPPGPSGLYVTANLNSSCGPRCTTLTTFQARSVGDGSSLLEDPSAIYIDYAVRFSCNNTISEVQDQWFGGLADPVYQFDDTIARVIAGTYGWSDDLPVISEITPVGNTQDEGNIDTNGSGRQIYYTSYKNASEIGYKSTPAIYDMASSIAIFTMGGITEMDALNSGLPRKYIENGGQPVQAQVLEVKWWAAGLILGLIPFVHFISLAIVIRFANRAVIKDDTHLAISKLYYSLLGKIGLEKGCILTGEEIIDELGDPSVAYGWTTGQDVVTTATQGLKVMHVDVFEESKGMKIHGSFPEAMYDGFALRRRNTTKTRVKNEHAKVDNKFAVEVSTDTYINKGDAVIVTDRSFDARDYF